MPARFIVVDGPDGAGKSTQVARLHDWLRDECGRKVLLTREPGGCEAAERIRELLLDAGAEGMSADAELLLMFAARHLHLQQTIAPTLQAGVDVLCDRYLDSSYAYQGAGRGVPAAVIDALAERLPAPSRPDRVLLLDVDEGVAEQRRRERGPGDRFDEAGSAFRRRVREAFRARAAAGGAHYRRIDANADIDTVQAAMRAAIEDLL